MEDLYVIEQGCVVKKEDIQFSIHKNGEKLVSIPSYKVEKVLLFGNQQITTQAVSMALENNIDVLFLTANGSIKGKLAGNDSKNIYLRLAQFDLWRDDYKKLHLAKIIVKGKVRNQYLLLLKYDIKCEDFKNIIKKIEDAESIEEIMGFEGMAGKIYFEKIKPIIPSPFEFNGRNRRPPKDEVNALLSLTYTMFLNHLITEIEKLGFDSYIGFLHGIKYGRKSLALDLLEEFRQGFCDSFTFKLLNRKEINKNDFNEKEGYKLTEDGFRKYIQKFNKEFLNYKENVVVQVNLLRESILTGVDYTPVKPKW